MMLDESPEGVVTALDAQFGYHVIVHLMKFGNFQRKNYILDII